MRPQLFFHYAGKVSYTVNGFLDKNKDALPEDMRTLLSNSSNALLSKIFTDSHLFASGGSEADELLLMDKSIVQNFLLLSNFSDSSDDGRGMASSGGSKSPHKIMGALAFFGSGLAKSNSSIEDSRKMTRRNSFMMAETVTMKFKNQLGKLIDMISATDVQYVRCIKPNTNKSSTEFSRPMVVEQLRSAGMIEAIRISRAAYPNRLLFQEMLTTFRSVRKRSWFVQIIERLILEGIADTAQQQRKICFYLLESILREWKGLSSIDDPSHQAMVDEYFQVGKSKVFCSSPLYDRLCEIRTKSLFCYSIVIQTYFRRVHCRCSYLKKRLSVIRLQAIVRAWRWRRWYRLCLVSIIKIQATMRMTLAVQVAHEILLYNKACLLQTSIRRYFIHSRFKSLKRSTIRVQAMVRMKAQRARFLILREHTRNLMQINYKMAFLQVFHPYNLFPC